MLVGREFIEAVLLKKEVQSWLDFFELFNELKGAGLERQ
jgi:hypothetical protein